MSFLKHYIQSHRTWLTVVGSLVVTVLTLTDFLGLRVQEKIWRLNQSASATSYNNHNDIPDRALTFSLETGHVGTWPEKAIGFRAGPKLRVELLLQYKPSIARTLIQGT